MKEYIERGALIEKIYQDPSENANVRIIQLLDAIILTPAADVVEVVRCKDCKNCETCTDGEKYCELHSDGWGDDLHYVDDDGYCSCGVRKDSNND